MNIIYTKKVTSQRPSLLVTLMLLMLCVTFVTAQVQRPDNQKPNTNKAPVSLNAGLFDTTNTGDQIKNAQNVSDFLDQMVKNKRLTTTDADYVITSEHISSLSGIHHIYYRQAINGIEIQGTESSLHLQNDGTLFRSNDRNLIKNINTRVKSSVSSLSAQQAIQTIAGQKNYGSTARMQRKSALASGYEVFVDYSIADGEILAKQMYYMVPNDGLRMAWEVIFPERTSASAWSYIIDASTGAIIDQFDLTVSCNIMGAHDHSAHDAVGTIEENCDDSAYAGMLSEVKSSTADLAVAADGASYNVYALPLESPFFGNRTLVVDPADPTASPFGWHDTNGVAGAEFTNTRGNNTHTYEDIANNNDLPGDPNPSNDIPGASPDGGASLVFNHAFDLTSFDGPSGFTIPRFNTTNRSLNASITNAFYWTNIIHDIAYQYGFDEASGNFQENNYGNGGLGSDSVNAESQDGGSTCNANFFTPPDGTNSRMQIYTCDIANPGYDGGYDNLVTGHEYAHGISTRLTGGAGDSGSLGNAEQMGEGWSDYYGYMLTMDASNFDQDRVVGTFLFGGSTLGGINGPGIRDAPYTADRNVTGANAFTHETITTLGAGAPPHSWGTVWATFLYDLTQNLMDQHGFDPDLYTGTGGNNISLALVTEALKLQPRSPGFVDGRDAILAADQALYGGANQCIIWESFANRGLGFSASQGDSDSRTDNTNAFDVPPITLAVTETNVCLANGEISLGGGVVSGGTYTGPGVSDDGNGSTFTFDPVAAGVGVHTITYEATDCNGLLANDTDTITVTEILPEISSCPDVTLALGADGTVTYDPFAGGLTVDIVGGNDAANANTQGFTLFFVPGTSITETTTVSFDWELITAATDQPGFDSFGYILGTTVFTLSPDVDPIESGTFSIEVPAGQNFGFGIITADNTFGAATATVSNFSPGYSGQFATANWQEFNQAADGTASFSGTAGPSLVSCGELTTNLSQSVFTCLDIGTTTAVTITVTDSLGNVDTCMADVTITGSALNTTTFTGGAWNNGDPTGTSMAIINDDYDTATLGDIDACSCQINTNQMVTVRDGDFMNIAGNIVVDGTLIVENAGSVVQMDDGAITTNNGTIQVQKTTPLLQPRDFTLLSSPMSLETRAGVYGSADRAFRIVSTSFNPDQTTSGAAGVTFLDVENDHFAPATSLNVGEGYIVFPQAVSDVGDVNFAHTYTQGTLNNGIINFPIVYNGPATANNFNLMGNPYPSAINVSTLISENVAINEVYYWEHITTPDEMLPGSANANFSMDDVSIRNQLGGIASANGGTAPGQFMSSGQGFGILANQTFDGTPLTFNNAMRVTGNNGAVRSNVLDINRIWLRLDSETFSLQNINLIGFTPEATIDFDEGFDSERLETTISLFSTLDSGELLSIQGREAFDSSMEIALGFATDIAENEQYTISIDQLEGTDLENVGVYLIDNELGTITNLKDSPYSFTATAGLQASRFTLVFQDPLLDVEDVSSLESGIRLFPNPARDQITLSYTGDQRLSNATIVDVNGKVLSTIDLSSFDQNRLIDTTTLATGVYFIRIESEQSTIVKRLLIN